MTAADRLEPTLRPLAVDACWELAASVPVGRIAVAVEGEAPLVVPVNHLVVHRTIVFRSGEGTKLDAVGRQPLAFQADAFDHHMRQGWSVLVRGVGSIERIDSEELQPWAGGRCRQTVVRLWPEHVSGRVVVTGALVWEPKGYI